MGVWRSFSNRKAPCVSLAQSSLMLCCHQDGAPSAHRQPRRESMERTEEELDRCRGDSGHQRELADELPQTLQRALDAAVPGEGLPPANRLPWLRKSAVALTLSIRDWDESPLRTGRALQKVAVQRACKNRARACKERAAGPGPRKNELRVFCAVR